MAFSLSSHPPYQVHQLQQHQYEPRGGSTATISATRGSFLTKRRTAPSSSSSCNNPIHRHYHYYHPNKSRLHETPPSSSSDVSSSSSSVDKSASLPKKGGPKALLLNRLFPTFPWYKLPNWLTYGRCVAIPILVLLFYIPNFRSVQHLYTGWLFSVASFTDWLDGYIARQWNVSSEFGAFLDPVADKLMVATALLMLCGKFHGTIHLILPTTIILCREIAVSALREWMAQRNKRDIVKVGIQGKIKTALTMIATTILLFVPSTGVGAAAAATTTTTTWLSKLYTPGIVLLYLCAAVTVTSGSVYFTAAAPLLFEEKENENEKVGD